MTFYVKRKIKKLIYFTDLYTIEKSPSEQYIDRVCLKEQHHET